ncbi:MAG: transposase [Gemmatimonadota bacterium]|jgi:hypothetical protein|nr:transposase [Gemmatimonadota bacterium]MDQ3522653.1 transposase [Gemmatimonadota bacterium]
MHTLPATILRVLQPFAPVFRRRVWEHVHVLVVGALLAPGQRTVTSALRVMGLSQERHFQSYHRVLSRATGSSREVSRILFGLLLQAFVPTDAPVVVGIDETIERRRGAKIAAKGIYRDPVRSSRSFFVKTSGLRWISLMLLTPIPWAKHVWALPFLTILAPSERYCSERGRRYKTITDWGRQALGQLRRWLPNRTLIVVADSTYAALELLARASQLNVSVITRLRLDAALYDPAPRRGIGTMGRPRKKGTRQPTLAERAADSKTRWRKHTVSWYGGTEREMELATGTAVWYHAGMPVVPLRWVLIRDPAEEFALQALLSTELSLAPEQILGYFVLRWQLEVTFHEVRTHLGVETQRQWSDLAIARTTPALLGLFSLVALFARELLQGCELPVRQAAWYPKPVPTFADTLALVRQHLWPIRLFATSPAEADIVKIPRTLYHRLMNTLAFAA